MNKKIWYFEEVDLYNILCPYKYDKHLRNHPLLSFQKDEFIFQPEEVATSIFLVAEGKVKVGYRDRDGKEIVKAYLGKGDIFGETSYLGNEIHKDFAQAIGPETRVCKMSAEKARELGRDYVPFALEIQRRASQNINRLQRRLEILFFKDVKRRLEELLNDLQNIYAESGNESYWVEHGLSQQEIGTLIGASPKTVSLLLNQIEREGKIQLEKGRFLILEGM